MKIKLLDTGKCKYFTDEIKSFISDIYGQPCTQCTIDKIQSKKKEILDYLHRTGLTIFMDLTPLQWDFLLEIQELLRYLDLIMYDALNMYQDYNERYEFMDEKLLQTVADFSEDWEGKYNAFRE